MDDEDSSGIGAGAAFLLGRMSAERSASQRDLLERFTARIRRPPSAPPRRSYDADEVHEVIDGWKAAVRSRDVTIAQLRTSNVALTDERDQLRARNAQLEAEALHMQAAYAELQRREELANKLWENAAEAGHKDDFDLFLARQEIATLQVQIERLKQAEK
ncbi:MAG: hypothetical protein EOP02_17075 [Proteobacteria bacterium]|nr:MAG: hypothetical protein EOP02_17075 [Pseudomonadota bacterium]